MFTARSGFAKNKWQCSENDFRFICAAADGMLRAVTQKKELADQKAELKPFLKKILK